MRVDPMSLEARHDVCHKAFFEDPDGNALELHQPLRAAVATRLTPARHA
jgi:hypothetical protein